MGLAAVGAWLYSQAGAKVPVLVMVAAVPAGQPITRADVSSVPVAGDVTAIAGANLPNVIGQYAAIALLPNMLLQRSMLSSTRALSSGESQVGVAVRSGQIPADGLVPGDLVEVFQLPQQNSSSTTRTPAQAQEVVAQAKVTAVRGDPAQAGGTLLTLQVPAADGGTVAAASGAGQVALIRVGAS